MPFIPDNEELGLTDNASPEARIAAIKKAQAKLVSGKRSPHQAGVAKKVLREAVSSKE